jgi:hypothetical protein
MKCLLKNDIQVDEEMKACLEEGSGNVKLDLLSISLIILSNVAIKDSGKYI